MTVSEITANDFEDYSGTEEDFVSIFSTPETIADRTQSVIPPVYNGNWEGNESLSLSEWESSQRQNLGQMGARCLLDMWLTKQKELAEGTYCNATWDNVYCWPPTPAGNIVTRPCSEVLHESEPALAHHINGNAVRVCLENGTWLWGNWTNYTECADSYDEYIWNTEQERKLVVVVQYILFIGSALSLICLTLALTIFFYFKCLHCDRVTVHIHLMLALMLRSALLIVITEPFIFNRTTHYRHVDIICKGVLSTNLYSTVASVNWMFIQGVYLHGKLTTNVFDKGTPFKVYYLIGWVAPLVLVILYACVLEVYHPVPCWKDYSERPEIWILLGPMIFALVANLLFLINIMRILLTKVQRPNSSSDSVQLRRAVKATFVLFPLLGVNNLLFLHNPGGEYHKYFVTFNAVLGSTQGIFVSILYCFVSKDVRAAIHRVYHRYKSRRSANFMGISHSLGNSVVRHSAVESQPKIHFRTTLRRVPQSTVASGTHMSGSISPELVMVHEVRGKSETPSENPLVLQEKVNINVLPLNRYSVSIPLRELER